MMKFARKHYWRPSVKKIRLAIIGDSHVSCLKEASSQQNRDDIDFDFFAVRGRKIRDTQLCSKKIIALSDEVKNSFSFTSAGKTEVKLDNYEAILLYASGLEAPLFSVKGHFSEAVLQRAVLISIANSSINHLYESLKNNGNTKVFVMLTPFRSIVNGNKSDMFRSDSLISSEFHRVFKEQYGFEFISQPEPTV